MPAAVGAVSAVGAWGTSGMRPGACATQRPPAWRLRPATLWKPRCTLVRRALPVRLLLLLLRGVRAVWRLQRPGTGVLLVLVVPVELLPRVVVLLLGGLQGQHRRRSGCGHGLPCAALLLRQLLLIPLVLLGHLREQRLHVQLVALGLCLSLLCQPLRLAGVL